MRLQLQRELRWFMFDNARNGKPRELWNRALAQFIIFPIAFNADTLHLHRFGGSHRRTRAHEWVGDDSDAQRQNRMNELPHKGLWFQTGMICQSRSA